MRVSTETDRDYHEIIDRFAPIVEARVERREGVAHIPEQTVEDLHRSGLMRMRVPGCLGGGEVDARTAYDAVERFSYVDGATGWTFMAGANLLGLAGAFLSDDAAEEVMSDPRSCLAGQVAPHGKAEATGHGYRIEGSFGFGSGARHANYMLGGFREVHNGEPVRLANGMPNVLAAVVSSKEIDFQGNWQVLGLQATGSVDYSVIPHEIPAGFTWPLFTGKPKRGGGFYRMGIFGITSIDHSAFSIGVARRALDDVATLAVEKKRAGRAKLVDDPVFQFEYAQAEAALRAARAFVLDAIGDLEQAAHADTVTTAQRAAARLAATHAARTGIEVTGMAYRYSGSTGLRNGSAIQQCMRDLTASEAHVFTDHNSWRDTAVALLGVAPDTLFL